MGHYEDAIVEVYYEVEKRDLRKEFEDQLKKMRSQERHRNKSMKEKIRIRSIQNKRWSFKIKLTYD